MADVQYNYTLECRQQPQRARMCGFGDKDRRPITPAPCVRLIIKDPRTNTEVDYNNIDITHFVVLVELRDAQLKDVTLVRSSANSAQNSISSAQTTSYPPAKEPQNPTPLTMYHQQQHHQVMPPIMPQGMYTGGTVGLAGYSQHMVPPPQQQQYGQYAPVSPYGMPQMQPIQTHMSHMTGYVAQIPMQMPAGPRPAHQGIMMGGTAYHRNLIGQLACNAFLLKDNDGAHGIWFILSDLSIRTEGSFRLQVRFFDLGETSKPALPPSQPAGVPVPQPQRGSPGSRPLAILHTDTFQVYSAKKFPGVTDGTALSKAFSNQGVKIPVRKDDKSGGKNGGGGDNDDDDAE